MKYPAIVELRSYIKNNFNKYSKALFEQICDEYLEILDKKEIVLKFDKELLAKFLKYNSSRCDELEIENKKIYKIKITFTEQILDYLRRYIRELNGELLKANDVDKLIDVEVDDNLSITPTRKFNYSSFIQNAYIDSKINYQYNNNIKKLTENTLNEISTINVEVISVGDIIFYPTKYEIICMHKDGKTNYNTCGRKVTFHELHKNSAIHCLWNFETRNLNDRVFKTSHTIKNIGDAQVVETIQLYSGICNVLKSSTESEEEKDFSSETQLMHDVQFLSLVPITEPIANYNAIPVTIKHQNFILLLSKQPDSRVIPLDEPILQKKSEFFLFDLFESLKKYYKKYHNYNIYNNNRWVGCLVLFITLANIYFGERYHMMVLGSSGSGKSFYAQRFLPMLTLKHRMVMGTNLTRNAFIGGKGNMKSLLQNSPFSIGYIGTQNVIVAEEAANCLDKFHLPNFDNSNNLFAMMKLADSPIDPGIQGSQTVVPTASVILFGNLEQLKSTEEYAKFLRREYFKRIFSAERESLEARKLKKNLPLFLPVEWYAEEEKNIPLARAHEYVRNSISSHYVTKLPSAEMARFAFFTVIEDVGEQKVMQPSKETESMRRLHYREFKAELDAVFSKRLNEEEVNTLRDDVFSYITKKLKERNNFGEEGKLNRHTLVKIYNSSTTLMLMQKLYYNLPMKFSEDDGWMIDIMLNYNYTSLTPEEAAMNKKPKPNDNFIPIVDVQNETVELNFKFNSERK